MVKSARRKRCFKGKSCGGTCINRGYACEVDLPTSMSPPMERARGKVSGEPLPSVKSSATPPKDKVQDLALEIRRKRRNKEDYLQEWNNLTKIINSLDGDAKRDATIKANAAIGKRLRIPVEHKSESKEEAQRAGRKLLREFKPLGRTVELINRYETLFNSVAQRVNSNLTSDQMAQLMRKLKDIEARKYRAEKRLEGIMEGVRARLMQTTLTDKQVRDLVSRVWTPNTSETTRAQMAEFVRMFNGRGFTDTDTGKSVRSLSETTERAYARLVKGIVRTSGEKETTFHEIAHIMEGQRPWMSRLAVQWRDGKAYDNIQEIQRSLGRTVPSQGFYKSGPNTTVPLVRLKDMFAGSKYNEGELAVVDRFMNKYMGKVYGANTPWKVQESTEVWSVAIQHFASPQAMAVLYRAHPELFEIAAGLAVSP